MLAAPKASQRARFDAGFGQRSLLTVDTEEEFDWTGDFHAHRYGLDHIRRIAKFQEFCEGLGVVPVYLVDWPITHSPMAVEIIGDALKRDAAEIGIQLHPWVNPPHHEQVTPYNSYAGNLPPDLMRDKFTRLRDAISENFQCAPQIYRAGRYGLGSQSARMLKDAGVAIDSSVRSLYDYRAGHGPDYSRHPLHPYWVDEDRRLLELPLTTVFAGRMRRQGGWLYRMAGKVPRMLGAMSRSGLLERIALTPEGTTVHDARRAIDIAVDDGLPLLVLSFHSPSLEAGNTPYVRGEDDLDQLYDWLRQAYDHLAARGVRPTTVREVIENVVI